MESLLDVFGFLAVILRGVCLSLEALLIGGSVYLLWVRRALENDKIGVHQALARRLLAGSAIGMLLAQVFWLSVNSALLQSTTGISWSSVAGAGFFAAGLLEVAGAAILLGAILLGWIASRSWAAIPVLLADSLLLLGSILTSHSAARLDYRLPMMAVTGGHQLGAALWVGSLPFLLWSLVHVEAFDTRARILETYAKQALAGVAVLVASGSILALVYIHSFPLLYGTAYGLMTVTKILLLGLMLYLGWQNNGLIKRKLIEGAWRLRLRRFTEAELGIGFTTILAAASLTSQPPAVDMQTSRVSAATIAARFTPHIPDMKTPPLEALSPPTPLNAGEARAFHASSLDTYVPGVTLGDFNKPADIAWSEYNHNWAGLIVLSAGLLAWLSRFRWGRWAKHWPLVFIGLAVFLLLRADSENWPLGPRGFWESFAVAEVAQHRLFVLLIVLFAIFEWSVQTKRLHSPRAALVFPGVCLLGGTLLLAHNHTLINVQDAFLAEMTHTPIAVLALVAGWARWLELRLPERPPRWAAAVWPVCFVGIGYFLMTYREH